MNRTLDIGPLRSSAIGRPLVERRGRGWRFTVDGEQLLAEARRILALHDKALRGFSQEAVKTVVIGSTEHAAAQLIPHLASSLDSSLPGYRTRFRIDRGTKLREAFAAGSIDLALLLGPADDPRATAVGDLELTWYAGPGWQPPAAGEPLPVVAFDHPCALRTRTLETLSQHSIPVVISAESMQLAGVHAAVSAGLGVALMATLGRTPESLVARGDLPRPEPIPLAVWSRQDLAPAVTEHVSDALRDVLAAPGGDHSFSVPYLTKEPDDCEPPPPGRPGLHPYAERRLRSA
jgi:DNA-binding transcriptional LysR family regulator